MQKLLKLYNEYKSLILYTVFGICTTLVNILSYAVFSFWMQADTTVSTVLSWILSVGFAFITNKLYFFNSRRAKLKEVISEITSFFLCRLFTGICDLGFMLLTVDVLSLPEIPCKLISNIFVIIINYILSKCITFKS